MTRSDDDLDIRQLLSEALSDEPSADLSDRVMSRLAAVKTVVELGRLVGVAPSNWTLGQDGAPATHDDDNDDDHNGDDDE